MSTVYVFPQHAYQVIRFVRVYKYYYCVVSVYMYQALTVYELRYLKYLVHTVCYFQEIVLCSASTFWM